MSREHKYSEFERIYELEGLLRKGRFGDVFTGYRRYDGNPIAIKFLKNSKVTSWDYCDGHSVPIEISLLKTCQEISGVINLLDWFKKEDGFVIVMERMIPSIDLFDYISQNGFLSENQAQKFFKQILDTIDVCYRSGVLHLDITDHNIMLDLSTYKVKLIDFGAGSFVGSIYFSIFRGTRAYAPPECIKKLAYKGIEATIWSLGILLYVMVFGEIPFCKDQEILSSRIFWQRSISEACQDLIKNCLSREPSSRPSLKMIKKHRWLSENI